MDADRAVGGQRDVALAGDRAAGRRDEDARARGIGVVVGRRGGPERLGGEAREADIAARSEEHTSELQSLMRTSYAVFCLNKKRYGTAHQDESRASHHRRPDT